MLIIIAVSVRGSLTVNQMAIVVASLAWLNPTRTIRAQVLTLRERGYVEVARLIGMSGPEIILREMMPNLLPYLAATLVNAVSAAILASIGLEVLGLGPLESPTLGMTLYWINFNAAIINGWWWWWIAPIVIILMVFLGLFFLTVGLDEIANPRLRRIGVSDAGPARRGSARRLSTIRSARCARWTMCQFALRPRRALRPGRRIRLRQIDHGAGDPAPDPARPAISTAARCGWTAPAVLAVATTAMRRLRLAGIALVPQGSMNSLNPVLRIGGADRRRASPTTACALSRRDVDAPRARSAAAGRPAARGRATCIRTNCRGGMKQRACIAIAICLRPR